MKRPQVTFFMLVTNRDCVLADYAIASYKKIVNYNGEERFKDFVLFVYLNCLSPENKAYYLPRWKAHSYVLLYDNAEKFSGNNLPFPGEDIVSPEGIPRKRDDYAENYDELWTTELKKFTSRYIATVDADFEILNADFYFYLMEELDSNERAIGASTNYDPTNEVFDSYSNRHVILNERNHTWFCLYKKQAFETSSFSHFYFERHLPNGKIHAYDSASNFQESLRHHGLEFITLPSQYQTSFVHYGASSKNKSLTKRNINQYRKIFQSCTIGLFKGRENLVTSSINKVWRKIGNRLFKNYLTKIASERSTYIYNEI